MAESSSRVVWRRLARNILNRVAIDLTPVCTAAVFVGGEYSNESTEEIVCIRFAYVNNNLVAKGEVGGTTS